ncbi:sulfite exporter TauE/SafE family protein [Halorientalis marina]|jgi:uncharacterized membrane protein YfcA|uniref:sulfite exporter TauE/SafE family protein n=1 Tax=Halorientalis marina TaxID=2931976 RepID=UPI001FF2D42B|nr:sulfite exporter TauE/SafE family protein [Halorientalis marina]
MQLFLTGIGLGSYGVFDIITLIISATLAGLITGLGGAGGPLIMAVLLLVVDLSPNVVAGTSSTIFVFGTVAGGSAYIYSADVKWRFVFVMIPPIVFGIQIGKYVNQFLSIALFRGVLSLLMIILGLNLLLHEKRELDDLIKIDIFTTFGKGILATIAFGTGILSGATGFGGAGLIIPVLMVLGVSPLYAIGTGLVQGIIITSVTSTRYILDGSVDFALILLCGIPFVVMMVTGWKIAQNIDEAKIKGAIGIILLIISQYIIIISLL